MSQRWTFESAVAFWRQHHNADLEAIWDRFIAAEAFILDHKPRAAIEADIVLEVLLQQGPDGRGDGRDRGALQGLRAYIRTLQAEPATAAA